MSDFFDYHCDTCDKPLCERIHVMNIALENLEDIYCLECLAKSQQTEPKAFFDFITGYIHSRECFETPWQNFDATPCPRITDNTCFCTVTAS